jgi:hypothetical protein
MKLRTGAWQRYCLDRRKIMTFAYYSAFIQLTYLSVAVEDLPLPVALARRGGTEAGTLAHVEQACHLAAATRYYEILHPVSMHGRHFLFSKWRFRNSAELGLVVYFS